MVGTDGSTELCRPPKWTSLMGNSRQPYLSYYLFDTTLFKEMIVGIWSGIVWCDLWCDHLVSLPTVPEHNSSQFFEVGRDWVIDRTLIKDLLEYGLELILVGQDAVIEQNVFLQNVLRRTLGKPN